MFRKLVILARLCVAMCVCAAVIAFAVSNRDRTALDFFPFPYVIEMPKYLLVLVLFFGGVLIGMVFLGGKSLRVSRSIRKERDRIAALENELTALRTEKQARERTASVALLRDAS